MSVATLKRKTQTQYNNMSVGSTKGFSLNGTRRSQGYVGQTTLSRSLPRTLMNGITPRGHGGCCGRYPNKAIVQSAVISLNDPTVVKPSVLSSYGRIENYEYKYGILRPQPFSTVKPDTNQNMNSSSTYTQYKKQLMINQTTTCTNNIVLTGIRNGTLIPPKMGNFKPVSILKCPTAPRSGAPVFSSCGLSKNITGRYNLINNYLNPVTKN